MDIQQKWDSFYNQKTRDTFHNFSCAQLDEIFQAFPFAKKALDIGCGEGQLMKELEVRGLITTGVDPSSAALNMARSQTIGILKLGTFEDVEFDLETSFDIIFIKFVLAFIDDYPLFFNKVDSLLNFNGGLIILTPVINGAKINKADEEIFTSSTVINQILPKYFRNITESVLYKEGDKKLSFYICKK